MSNLSHIAALAPLMVACSKNPDCHDPSLKAGNRVCPMDCPGVCGCDGQTYCNECIAELNGIPSSTPGNCK